MENKNKLLRMCFGDINNIYSMLKYIFNELSNEIITFSNWEIYENYTNVYREKIE